MLSAKLDHVKFILPTAPTQPVTLNMGMPMPSWYDIVGLDDRASESCAGIEESRETVLNILDEEHAAGVRYDRMVLAGFSQGGALSLFTGMQLHQEKKLAGVVVMSGYLAAASTFKLSAGLENTPLLHCHGESDPMVRHEWGIKTRDALTEMGATNYTMKSYPALQHSVDERVISDVFSFIEGIIPPSPDFLVPLRDPGDMSVKELKAAIKEAGLSSKAVGFAEKSDYVEVLRDHYKTLR